MLEPGRRLPREQSLDVQRCHYKVSILHRAAMLGPGFEQPSTCCPVIRSMAWPAFCRPWLTPQQCAPALWLQHASSGQTATSHHRVTSHHLHARQVGPHLMQQGCHRALQKPAAVHVHMRKAVRASPCQAHLIHDRVVHSVVSADHQLGVAPPDDVAQCQGCLYSACRVQGLLAGRLP